MIKSKELTAPNSCLSRARDDELLFVLLERDKCAPIAVMAWILARVAVGKNEPADEQIREAVAVVERMQLATGGIGEPPTDFLFKLAFRQVQQYAHEVAVEKGWWDGGERNQGEMIALMHSELSEGLEALRHGNGPSEHIPEFSGVEEELADVIIRIMDNAERRGWRVAEAVLAKMAFNRSRPHKHGGKAF